jgi:hypothetical protein
MGRSPSQTGVDGYSYSRFAGYVRSGFSVSFLAALRIKIPFPSPILVLNTFQPRNQIKTQAEVKSAQNLLVVLAMAHLE